MLDHLEPLLFSPSSFDLYRSTNYVGIWPCFDVRQDYLRTEFTPAPLHHPDTHPQACCSAKHVACHLAQAADAFFSNQSSGIRHPRSTSLWEHHFFSFLKERLQLQLLAVTYYQIYHIRSTYSITIRYILQPFSIR